MDVAIGIVFIFLLTSLIASAIREGLEAWLKTRASHLEAGLREILKDPDGTAFVQQFYNQPLIYSLFSGEYEASANLRTRSLLFKSGRNLPSYIPSGPDVAMECSVIFVAALVTLDQRYHEGCMGRG